MNTNALKKFAQKARNLLLEDVSKRCLYWGFDKKGNILHIVEATGGGYLFRGAAHDDASIPAKWNSLESAVGRHSVQDIIEEAAYTWFNRLMAIKILEQNGYDQPVLTYAAADLHEPVILRNAKKGIYPTSNPQEIQVLKRRLAGANDDEALAALLISYCRNHQLLNRIFGHLDDYTELLIPGALLAKGGILELLNDEGIISVEDYREVELIGWLYQFYISDKKEDVFAGFRKKKKARAEDIPAATQIFTPKWIVKYLVENTVGRIWLDLHPESPIRETMKYLVEPENHTPDDPIIQDVTELKVLDPAVGSGHFLVVAFDLLMQMYQEEGYSKRKAVASIIEHNVFGVDICPRATGLANFAILLKAAQHHGEVLQEAHFPKVFAMPEPFDFTRQQVGSFLGTEETSVIDEVHIAFKVLKQGQNIGSALILNLSDTSRTQLLHALNVDRTQSLDLSDNMTLKRMRPFAEVTSILTDQFPAVVANPPYMGSKNMNAYLANYLKANYPGSKSDLFAVFMEVLPNRTIKGGRFGFITTPSWMFLGTYERLRNHYLKNFYYRSLLHLSRGVFGADFGASAAVLEKSQSNARKGEFLRLIERTFQEFESEHLHQLFLCVLKDKQFKYKFRDYSKEIGIPVQSNPLGKRIYYSAVEQSDFSKIPGSPIAYWVSKTEIRLFEREHKLGDFYEAKGGMTTGNNAIFVRGWHELNINKIGVNLSKAEAIASDYKWFPYNNGGSYRKWYGNKHSVINWYKDGSSIKKFKLDQRMLNPNYNVAIAALDSMFKPQISWSLVSSSTFGVRYYCKGFLFDVSGSSIFVNDENEKYIIALCNTKLAQRHLALLNPTINYQPGNVRDLIFKLDTSKRTMIDEIVSTLTIISKNDWDSRELSWDFEQSPLLNNSPSISISISLWAKNVSAGFFQTLENEIKLNCIFNEIYGLQEELTSDIELNNITLLQDELDTERLIGDEKLLLDRTELPINHDIVIKQFLSYAVGCFMGRYRLDKPGLNIAHPNPTADELSSYAYNGYTFEIDDDAIIPTMGSDSPFSDDIVQRFQQFVLMVWEEESYTENLNFINEALGEDLEKFLTRKFWDFHKKIYKKRPIYWQFASPKGAFKVLTYMHRMNRFTIQKIRQNYLFKQINYLESEIARLKANEASLNTTESRKLDRFRSNLMECRDYDLLLKDVADRQIEFDLDDGVVENYKLFEGVVSKI